MRSILDISTGQQESEVNYGTTFSIAPKIVDIMRLVDADSKINDIRDREFTGRGDLEGLFNGESKKALQGDIETVMKNNDWILEKVFQHLGVPIYGKGELFHSAGAVSGFENGGLIHASNSFSGIGGKSLVSRAYDEHTLRGMSLQKMSITSIFHEFRGSFELTTQLMQAVIIVMGVDREDPRYYRGLYSHQGKSVGVSGTYVPHDFIDKIFTHLDPVDSIDFDFIAPERQDRATQENVGRVDLLASIFDELFARLVLHDVKDWEYQIKLVAEDIKMHFKKSQMTQKPDDNEIWKLC